MAFNLNSISKAGTRKSSPVRMVIYGTAGVGKTTFATRRPGTIVLRTEDGLSAIGDVDAFDDVATSYTDLASAIDFLAEGDHSYKHLVLDSADWAEKLLEAEVAKEAGLKEFNLQAKELAYGRGNQAVGQKWRYLLQGFDALRNERGMSVILVAHSQVKRFDDPTTDAYDRYTLDLNKESAAVLTEWADIVGFAGFRVSVKEEQVGINGKKKRGISSGERFLFTQETPAFIAKSRYYFDGPQPLDGNAFFAELEAAQA